MSSSSTNLYPAGAWLYRFGEKTTISPYNYSSYGLTTFQSKTDTVRRSKPVDLFANGTAFNTVKRRITRTYGLRYDNATRSALLATADYWTAVGVPGIPLELPESEVRMKILERIKSQNVNLAQAVGEYRQTCSMFAGAARDIVRTFHSFRSGRAVADVVRYLQHPHDKKSRDVASRWLEYQYGFKPLLSDIYGSAEALATELIQGKLVFVSASAKKEKLSSDVSATSDGGRYPRNWTETSTSRIRARYRIRDTSIKQFSQLGFTNPLLLAWEFIPFSFVVDWLVPVGNWLSCLDALAGVDDLRWNQLSTYKCQAAAYAWGGKYDFVESRTSRYATNTNGTIPLPRLAYKPSESWTKVVNGLALLTQLKGKFK